VTSKMGPGPGRGVRNQHHTHHRSRSSGTAGARKRSRTVILSGGWHVEPVQRPPQRLRRDVWANRDVVLGVLAVDQGDRIERSRSGRYSARVASPACG
jgi:hypothetical protein